MVKHTSDRSWAKASGQFHYRLTTGQFDHSLTTGQFDRRLTTGQFDQHLTTGQLTPASQLLLLALLDHRLVWPALDHSSV